MKVKGNHPLSEVIAKKLFGIENVGNNSDKQKGYMERMVNNACKAAVEWHEFEMNKAKAFIYAMIDEDECQLDHHGYCQTHNWFDESECINKRALEFLRSCKS